MAERGLHNESPFAAQELYLTDEEGRDLVAVVVQATYAFGTAVPLTLVEEQPPVDVAGTFNGEPGASSYRNEPQMAPLKVATDVMLVGHAHAQRHGATSMDVGFQVGPVGKVVRVFGDRRWYRRMGFEAISEPHPFERVPLTYDRAFGGWDTSPEDPEKHTVEARNSMGVGYHNKKYCTFIEDAPVPNIEDPKHLINDYTDTPPPAGFGVVGPDWTPRAQYAGTYDEAWMQRRMPLLPKDFDRRFYNAASPGLIAPGFLRGNEPVVLAGVVPEGRLSFSLPGEPPPSCTIITTREERHPLSPQLDTVVIDTDARTVSMLWRAHLLVPGGRIHDIQIIKVEPNPASVHAAPAPVVVAAR